MLLYAISIVLKIVAFVLWLSALLMQSINMTHTNELEEKKVNRNKYIIFITFLLGGDIVLLLLHR